MHPRPPGSEEEICFVCNDTGCDESNMIVFCDKCNVPVHQSCYGIPEIPDSEWYCAPCKVGFENVVTIKANPL